MLKKNSFGQNNGTKKALFCFVTPTHHSFTINLRFFHELKHKVCLSKAV